jgi:hypothetical protein
MFCLFNKFLLQILTLRSFLELGLNQTLPPMLCYSIGPLLLISSLITCADNGKKIHKLLLGDLQFPLGNVNKGKWVAQKLGQSQCQTSGG